VKENSTTENIPDAWEQKGRSINSAAFFALLTIGVMYFYGQAVCIWIVVIVQKMFYSQAGDPEQISQLPHRLIPSLRLMIFFSQYLIMFLPSWFLLRRWHSTNVPKYIRLKSTSPALVLLSVLGTISLIPVSIAFSSMLVHKIGIPEKILTANNSFITTYTPVEFAWVLVVVAVTPALCEEFFFRGHFQRTLERTFGWKSVLIAGVIFGLFHFQPLGLMSLSILGLFFGYVYYRSQSILTSMAAHFTNNAIILFFDYRPSLKSQTYWDISQNISSELLAGSFITAIFIVALFHRLTRRSALPLSETVKGEPLPQKESFPSAGSEPLNEFVSEAVETVRTGKLMRAKKSKRVKKIHVRRRAPAKRSSTPRKPKAGRPVKRTNKPTLRKRTKKN
jgi:membrane protease YdiL (CAAX protease family)